MMSSPTARMTSSPIAMPADGRPDGPGSTAPDRRADRQTGRGRHRGRAAEDGWVVGIEVVEDRRIPSSSDILAAYETALDMDGQLLSYRRVRRYPRGRADQGI